jgi:hypothetical protein
VGGRSRARRHYRRRPQRRRTRPHRRVTATTELTRCGAEGRSPVRGSRFQAVSTTPMMLVRRERTVEPIPAAVRQKGAAVEPCREDAMTAWPTRARPRRAGALLGAVAVLVGGCTTVGGGSGQQAHRAGPARHSVAASPPSRVVAHRIAGTPVPDSVNHDSGPRIGGVPSVACAPPLGAPVVNLAGAAYRLRVTVPACLCCHWCACAWACCGCGPGRWPRSQLSWQCCPRWLGPPGGDISLIWPVCGPGCGSRACPFGPARPAAGSVQVHSPGGAAAGES